MCCFSVLFCCLCPQGSYSQNSKIPIAGYEEPRLIMLLVHQNVKHVYAKMALETSRTAFVFKRQACIAILAETPPFSKNTKLCKFR